MRVVLFVRAGVESTLQSPQDLPTVVLSAAPREAAEAEAREREAAEPAARRAAEGARKRATLLSPRFRPRGMLRTGGIA